MINSYFRGIALASVLLLCAETALAGGTCPADVNNDSSVNSTDLLAVVSAWGGCPAQCPADIAPVGGDGVVSSTDLLSVIGGWGACPPPPPPCGPANGCLLAAPLWCENFELSNYSRWSGTYSAPSTCESTGFSTERARSATKSHKSQILCSTSVSHRGYAGLRFQGDTKLPNFSTPSTGGINAPYGVVVTQWLWVDSPYTFDSTRWLSLLTVTDDCSNNWNTVVTLNIDDASMRLKPVHVTSVSYATAAPAFTRAQWNRVTTYINYYTGSMHVWQNGAKVCSATFSRATPTMCQWHFGLYASGPNDNITMFEDDLSLVKLLEPMTNFTIEPRFPSLVSPCGIAP